MEDQHKAFRDVIAKESEVGCFFAMQTLSYMSWKLNHDAGDGRIEDGKHIDDALKIMGEEMEIVGERIAKITGIKVTYYKKVTPEYRKWYDSWAKYIEKLPREELELIIKRVNAKEDTSDIKPTKG